jgi:hypothetical protein
VVVGLVPVVVCARDEPAIAHAQRAPVRSPSAATRRTDTRTGPLLMLRTKTPIGRRWSLPRVPDGFIARIG